MFVVSLPQTGLAQQYFLHCLFFCSRGIQCLTIPDPSAPPMAPPDVQISVASTVRWPQQRATAVAEAVVRQQAAGFVRASQPLVGSQ